MGAAACTAVLPVTEAFPSDCSAGSEALANPHWFPVCGEEHGARFVNSVFSCPDAAFRFWSTGVLVSAAVPSLAIAGLSCASRPGKRWRVVLRLACWVAVSVAAWSASTMKFWTCLELLASAVTTASEFAVRSCRVCESLASRFSRLSVSSSAGTARRSAVWRSSERPATAPPSSLMISEKRSRWGRRMMSASRSAGIVENVCEAGSVAPDFSGLPCSPGWQSTKYSPISDWGRDWQLASDRKAPNPLLVTSTVTTAW